MENNFKQKYTNIPNNYKEVLPLYAFTGSQRSILDIIERQTLGFKDIRESILFAPISYLKFSKCSGIARQNIPRIIAQLSDYKVIIVKKQNNKPNEYSINKDVRQWLIPLWQHNKSSSQITVPIP